MVARFQRRRCALAVMLFLSIAASVAESQEADESTGTRASSVSIQPVVFRQSTEARQSIDLLALFDLKHQRRGDWKRDGTALVCSNGVAEFIILPMDLPTEFDLKVEMVRLSGRKGFSIYVRNGDLRLAMVIDSAYGSAFDLAGNYTDNASKTRTRFLTTGKPIEFLWSARRDQHTVSVAGQVILKFAGDYPLFEVGKDKSVNMDGMALVGNESSIRFTKIELIPFTEPSPVVPVAAPPAELLPPPDAAAIAKAKALMETVLGDELKQAETPAAHRAIATRCLTLALQETEPSHRYVLWMQAQESATANQDYNLAIQALERRAQSFEIDFWSEVVQLYTHCAKEARTLPERKQLLSSVQASATRAATDEAWQAAAAILSIAADVALKARLIPERKQLLERQKEMETLQAAVAELAAAREAVAKQPDDPAANELVGRLLCQLKLDFATGLAHLAKGPASPLQELAARDRASPMARRSPWPTPGGRTPNLSPPPRAAPGRSGPGIGIVTSYREPPASPASRPTRACKKSRRCCRSRRRSESAG